MSLIINNKQLLDTIESLEIRIKKHEEAIRYILTITKDYNERHNDNLQISCMSAFIEKAAEEIYK
jgi:hypothetical protein